MHLKQLQTGPLWVNTYILGADGDNRCMVIDPGAAAPVLDYLLETGYICTHILITHGHFDHIGGVRQIHDETGAKVCVHRLDVPKLGSNRENLSFLKGMSIETTEPDVILEDGNTFDAAGLTVQVLHTPGHSKGAVCYVIESERAIFCGDTLFFEGAGRTDFPNCSQRELYHSIVDKIYALEGEYTIYCGHDEGTTLEHEKKFNPLTTYGRKLGW